MSRRLIAFILLILIVLGTMPITVSAVPPVTRDTVLVLDRSASMSGTKLTTLKNAAIEFCKHILAADGINRVAIVFYSSSLKTHEFTDDLSELTDFINSMTASGSTDINSGLKKADEMLKSSTARIKNIVLMTDGVPCEGDSSTEGPYSYDDSPDHYAYANTVYETAVALHDDYRIYTIGFFGGASGQGTFSARLLNDIQNAGYYEADDSEELEEFFEEIAEKIADDDGDSYDYRKRLFFFPLPILPPNFNHSNLNFSTNGGAAIDPITLPTGTTVQLSQYIPLRDGYEFVGWCRDEALTRTITQVQVIDPNTIVYAKWSPVG